MPSLHFFSGASGDAEDRIILGYISRPFRLSLYVLGYIPSQLGPRALKQSGPESQVLWPHIYYGQPQVSNIILNYVFT